MKTIVDHMNIVHISFNVAKSELFKNGIKEFTEEHLGFFYHNLFNYYNWIFKTYGQIIIANEGKNSLEWRRKIYPEYKKNRDKSKNEPEYKILRSTFNKIEEVLSFYPSKQIKVDGTEADDVIFALSTYLSKKGEDVIIISSDEDLTQIIDYGDNISVYNPIKKKIVNKKVEEIVKYKAIVGDKSDNIPGLHKIGIKTFYKMLEDKNVWNEKMKGDNFYLYETFLKIVDLSKFPLEKHNEIIDMYENTEFSKFDVKKIESFYFENNLVNHIENWGSESSKIMEKLF